MRRALQASAVLVAALALTGPADAACIKLGVYQDNITKTLLPLTKAVGPGLKTVSVYVTAGTGLDPKLVSLANKDKLTVLVSWMPDKGKDGPAGKKYSLSAVATGKFDAGLRALGVQLRSLRKSAIVRPMPEPNTPWYAWSGAVSGNSPAEYVKAWKHVRGVLRKADPKVRLMWAPYARSVPDTPQNTIASYFPGAKQVDLVGASAANFGTTQGLAWSTPSDLFATAYTTIEGLAKKPFWIAETGSTAKGGDQRGWIQSLGTLRTSMPMLSGVVWFDVKDPNGDFRLRATPATTSAFRRLLKGGLYVNHVAGKQKSKRVKQLKYHKRKRREHVPPAIPPNTVSVLSMTQPMVDRLFWRAGFGPAASDRATWVGKPVTDAVDSLLTTPGGPLVGVGPSNNGAALDPFGNDTDLVLSWVDQMVRTPNPFVERMTFYWHRHFANSRQTVSPPQLLTTQNALFRSYSDLSAKPAADFKSLANDVSVDPSMLRYLTGESNVAGAANENYARELMELFTLGPVNDAGAPNYSEEDVQSIAKALTGWQINDGDPNAASSYFTTGRWYAGPKFALGQFGNWKTTDIVSLVLSQPNHPVFVVRKLWGEFIPTPPDAPTLQALTTSYLANGMQLKPLLQQILTHPDLFASIDEPNMLKPPVVYTVGVLRALGRTITDSTAKDYLDAMGQLPYFPPNVSGWEGGLSWLNTNTALARWGFVARLVTSGTPITDVLNEAPQAAYDRAYAAVGAPWLAAATQAQILAAATGMPSKTPTQRLQRQQVLRTLMLAGPDAQVM